MNIDGKGGGKHSDIKRKDSHTSGAKSKKDVIRPGITEHFMFTKFNA